MNYDERWLREFPTSEADVTFIIQTELDSLNDEWGMNATWQINHKLTSSLGQTYLEPTVIEIAPKLVHDLVYPRGEIIDTIRHEFAHLIDYCLRNKSDHSPYWRKIAEAVGARPRATSWTSEAVEYVVKVAKERKKP